MKIVAINGSPRGMQGNTGRLLEEVLSGVRLSGGETEVISLSKARIGPCVACDACHKIGICPIDDSYEDVRQRLLECDAFVLASPNYIFNVSSQMKSLFDRCNGLIHCVALEGKYAALVETSGGGGDDEVLGYMGRFANTLGALSVGSIGSPMAGVRSFPNETELFAKARKLGEELCSSVREKRSFPEQDEFRQSFRARMQGLVDYMQDHWVFEREYWQKKQASK
ncbi:MAG TPA: flavodoxin family protein [Desulfuromonadaceae bacterium]